MTPISGTGVHDGLKVLLLAVFVYLAVPSGHLPYLHVSMVAHDHGESVLHRGSRVGHGPVLDELRHLLRLVSHLKVRHVVHVQNLENFANVLDGLVEVMKQITDLGKPVGARLGGGGVRQVQRTYTQKQLRKYDIERSRRK